MNSNIENIARLVEYIEEHLTEKLDLSSLAQHVGYSKYHLHRMFANVVGFPVHDYVQRRKLTEAARLLIFSEQTIIDIAFSAGYETQQSFTKAFKAQFGDSPHEFRKKREFYPFQLKFTVNGKKQLRGDKILDFKIIESDKILLVGHKANTGKGFSVIGECWGKLNQTKDSITNRIDMGTVIALDDYTTDFACTEQPAFNYYAAVEVSSLSDVPHGMDVRELPASKYVAFSYIGSPQDSMQPVVEYIYKEWFPQSSAQLDENNMIDFAKLSEELDAEGKGAVEFWVPIL